MITCHSLLHLMAVKLHSGGAECVLNLISLWRVMRLTAAPTLAVILWRLLWFNLQTFHSRVCYPREWLISFH